MMVRISILAGTLGDTGLHCPLQHLRTFLPTAVATPDLCGYS